MTRAADAGSIVTPSVRRALALVIALGALVHFIGLTYPRQVVFDEVHWGKSASAYCCTGQRVFDIHPPHGKLLLALGAKLGGYDGTFSFEQIGQPYTNQPVFFLRLVPAIAGIAIPALFLILLRQLGASPPAALLGGLALVFDNAMLLETRLILFDGILVAAILGSLVCLLAVDRAASPLRQRLLCAGAGALAGLAVGTKFTGLVSPALIVLILLKGSAGGGRAMPRLHRFVIIVAAALVVYLGGWAIHFALTPNPGPADAFHPTTGHFFQDLWVIHKTMLSTNFSLAQTHPDASRPLTWPLMKVAPYFWAGDGASIYLVGNPVVWWGASLLFVVFTVNSLLMMVTRLRVEAPGAGAGGRVAAVRRVPHRVSAVLRHHARHLSLPLPHAARVLDRVRRAVARRRRMDTAGHVARTEEELLRDHRGDRRRVLARQPADVRILGGQLRRVARGRHPLVEVAQSRRTTHSSTRPLATTTPPSPSAALVRP